MTDTSKLISSIVDNLDKIMQNEKEDLHYCSILIRLKDTLLLESEVRGHG